MNKIRRGFERVSDEQFQKDITDQMGYIYTPTLKTALFRMPERATKDSAGYDFFSPFAFELKPQESIIIPTGFSAYMQPDEVLMLYPRSGQGFKHYIRLANTVGVIDADYYGNEKNEGHIMIKLRNESPLTGIRIRDEVNTIVNMGCEAFCQGVFSKYLLADNDNQTNIRNGGFGSTGVNNNA